MYNQTVKHNLIANTYFVLPKLKPSIEWCRRKLNFSFWIKVYFLFTGMKLVKLLNKLLNFPLYICDQDRASSTSFIAVIFLELNVNIFLALISLGLQKLFTATQRLNNSVRWAREKNLIFRFGRVISRDKNVCKPKTQTWLRFWFISLSLSAAQCLLQTLFPLTYESLLMEISPKNVFKQFQELSLSYINVVNANYAVIKCDDKS